MALRLTLGVIRNVKAFKKHKNTKFGYIDSPGNERFRDHEINFVMERKDLCNKSRTGKLLNSHCFIYLFIYLEHLINNMHALQHT